MPSMLKLVALAIILADTAFALPGMPAVELPLDGKPLNIVSTSFSRQWETESDRANQLRTEVPHVVTHKEIGLTNLKLTFVDPGTTSAEISPFAALATRVEGCDTITGSCCGGVCIGFDAGKQCVALSMKIACLRASKNVGFCTQKGCKSCKSLSNCQRKLDERFCATPGTVSINVLQ